MSISSCVTSLSPLSAAQLFDEAFEEHREVLRQTQSSLKSPFEMMVTRVAESLRTGGKILFCGNGGSAADCQHLATEFTVKFKKPRCALAAIALTTDTSALSAIGNDFGFEHLFSRQIEALGKERDVLIAISTSAKSPNVLKAIEVAKHKGLYTIAFAGCDGKPMTDLADLSLVVPSFTVSRIQEMHILLGQLLVEAIETQLELV